MNKTLLVLICLVFAGIAFADLQISSPSLTPTTLRPGNTGSASFTLTNTGPAAVTGVTLSPSGYGFEFFIDKLSVGTIGASGSTPVNIQFRVSPTVESGVYNIMITAYWNEQTVSGGTGYKVIQIPVTVTKQTIFQIYSSPETVGIGDDFEAEIRIKNTGGKASNVIMMISSPYFIAKDSSKMNLGSIGAGETIDITIPISTSLSMPAGVYSVPVTINYQDELGDIQQTTATLGTVNAVKGSVDFSVTPSFDSKASPGKRINVNLEVRNDGTVAANYVKCTLSSSSTNFLPIGSAQRLLGDIKPGGKASVSYDVGISADSKPGYYPVTVTLDYLDKHGEAQTTISKTIGVEVVGVSELSVIATTNPSPVVAGGKYSLSIQISNIGTTDLKSLQVAVESDSFTNIRNSDWTFIGNLKTDDYSQVNYDVIVKKSLAPGRYPIVVKMEFMDEYNNKKKVEEITYLQVVSPEIAAAAGDGGAGGPNIGALLLLLLIVAVVLYLLYKRFFRKRENGKR